MINKSLFSYNSISLQKNHKGYIIQLNRTSAFDIMYDWSLEVALIHISFVFYLRSLQIILPQPHDPKIINTYAHTYLTMKKLKSNDIPIFHPIKKKYIELLVISN